jgi:hypothetical protein
MPKGPDIGALFLSGSRGRIAVGPAGLSCSRRLLTDASHRAGSGEPASSQVQTLLISKQKWAPQGGPSFVLLAGARFALFRQD